MSDGTLFGSRVSSVTPTEARAIQARALDAAKARRDSAPTGSAERAERSAAVDSHPANPARGRVPAHQRRDEVSRARIAADRGE